MINFKITQEQHNNLSTLSNFLKSHNPPPKFDMRNFVASETDGAHYRPSRLSLEFYSRCGTVACAVGHGPLAGITPLSEETWVEYADRVFGTTASRDIRNLKPSIMFGYLFGGEWGRTDNTPEGAAARIDFFLENDYGVPSNWRDQIEGYASFRIWI